MNCPNCQLPIINPIEHEFCAYPRTANYDFDSLKPYVAPKQQPVIKHQLANPGAKPPPDQLPVFVSKPWMKRKLEDEKDWI